jgi:hypothetical protein
MSDPPRMLTRPRIQVAILGLLAAGFALGGFQVGRRSVDAAALNKHIAETRAESPNLSQRDRAPSENALGQGSVREIATVPFSELYDVIKSASREQLVAWARDLERLPRGPRQRAAVTAYYKSLIQVDHRAAIEALFQAENLNVRDVAINALLKAAPESIWADLAEMMEQLPYPGRGYSQEDLILNWSRVDPLAASEFIEKHPFNAGQGLPDEQDSRLVSLLSNWGEIDPASARAWIEADSSRQTTGSFRAFVTNWAHVDRGAAIDYAVANAGRPTFASAINELSYDLVRVAKEDATRIVLLLPREQAIAAIENTARITTTTDTHDFPADYQRPPDEVARWMVSLPVELWDHSIGVVAEEWLDRDATSARPWFNQLPPDLRDVAIANSCHAAISSYHSEDEVIKLGLTISDRTLRDTALGELARSFQTTTPGAMSAAERINELSISEEQKAYLLGLITRSANGR